MAAIEDLRRRYDTATAKLKAEQLAVGAGPQPTEQAMEESDKFLPKPTPTRAAKGKERLVNEAKERSRTTGVEPEKILPRSSRRQPSSATRWLARICHQRPRSTSRTSSAVRRG